MEISAELSLLIYHSASHTRNASYDECFFDEAHRRKSYRRSRSCRSNFGPAGKLEDRNCRRRRMKEAAADVQLNLSSNPHQISVSSENIRSFPSSARMLDVDYHFSPSNKVHRHKLNPAVGRPVSRASSHRLAAGWWDKSHSIRMALMPEILFRYVCGSELDTLCRLFRNHWLPCNSTLSHFHEKRFASLLTIKLTLQKSTVHAWLFNKAATAAENKQNRRITIEVFIEGDLQSTGSALLWTLPFRSYFAVFILSRECFSLSITCLRVTEIVARGFFSRFYRIYNIFIRCQHCLSIIAF